MNETPTPPEGYELIDAKTLRAKYDEEKIPAGLIQVCANAHEGWEYNFWLPRADWFYAIPVSDNPLWNVETQPKKVPKDTPPEDPKGEAGKTKAQLQLIPPVFNSQVAKALACGAAKYGPWNWREHKVEMMTYLGAMKRHIDQVIDREDQDPESHAHHLGHVAAGCAIVLDAMRHGTLIDNRPSVTRD